MCLMRDNYRRGDLSQCPRLSNVLAEPSDEVQMLLDTLRDFITCMCLFFV